MKTMLAAALTLGLFAAPAIAGEQPPRFDASRAMIVGVSKALPLRMAALR